MFKNNDSVADISRYEPRVKQLYITSVALYTKLINNSEYAQNRTSICSTLKA